MWARQRKSSPLGQSWAAEPRTRGPAPPHGAVGSQSRCLPAAWAQLLLFRGGNQGWGQALPWPCRAPPCSVSAQQAASWPHRPEHSSGPWQPLASRGPQLPAGCPVGCAGSNGLPGPPALLPGGMAAKALRDVPKTSQQILRADRKPRRFCMRPDPGLCEKRFSIECLVVNCSSNWFSRV